MNKNRKVTQQCSSKFPGSFGRQINGFISFRLPANLGREIPTEKTLIILPDFTFYTAEYNLLIDLLIV